LRKYEDPPNTRNKIAVVRLSFFRWTFAEGQDAQNEPAGPAAQPIVSYFDDQPAYRSEQKLSNGVEYHGCYPLMQISGSSRATFFDRPAASAASTTALTSL